MKFFIPFAALSIVAYFFNLPSEEKIRNAFKVQSELTLHQYTSETLRPPLRK